MMRNAGFTLLAAIITMGIVGGVGFVALDNYRQTKTIANFYQHELLSLEIEKITQLTFSSNNLCKNFLLKTGIDIPSAVGKSPITMDSSNFTVQNQSLFIKGEELGKMGGSIESVQLKVNSELFQNSNSDYWGNVDTRFYSLNLSMNIINYKANKKISLDFTVTQNAQTKEILSCQAIPAEDLYNQKSCGLLGGSINSNFCLFDTGNGVLNFLASGNDNNNAFCLRDQKNQWDRGGGLTSVCSRLYMSNCIFQDQLFNRSNQFNFSLFSVDGIVNIQPSDLNVLTGAGLSFLSGASAPACKIASVMGSNACCQERTDGLTSLTCQGAPLFARPTMGIVPSLNVFEYGTLSTDCNELNFYRQDFKKICPPDPLHLGLPCVQIPNGCTEDILSYPGGCRV